MGENNSEKSLLLALNFVGQFAEDKDEKTIIRVAKAFKKYLDAADAA